VASGTDLRRLRKGTAGPGPNERSERRMRIALLAPADSPYTQRWADVYASRGIDVYAISLESHRNPGGARPRVRTAYLPTLRGGLGLVSPRAVARLRALLDQARPDVVHTHLHGSGGGPYGLLGALADRHPYVVSITARSAEALGAGPAQRRTLEFALRRADAICVSSAEVADAVARFTDVPVTLIPSSADLTTDLTADLAGPDDSDAWERNATLMLDVYAGLDTRGK
jgi:hypothetical protein